MYELYKEYKIKIYLKYVHKKIYFFILNYYVLNYWSDSNKNQVITEI